MVHVVVLQGLAAIMAGLAVHMALGPVRAGAGLLVALVRALLDGFGGHIGALPVLALLNLGVENFAGPAGRVGGQPCAAFAAFLALLFSPMPLAAHQRDTEMWQSWDSAMVGLVLSRLTFASAGL